MSDKNTADTVPGLGFKDKEKAEETLKILEGRDPDYQKLAIKGLIGRAKRTLTLTKAEEKIQNIKEALKLFENWLKEYDLNDLSKENRSYLPLSTIEALLPLKNKYEIEDEKAEKFLKAYRKVKGDYKHLRTVASGEDQPTWDIVRNKELKALLEKMRREKSDLWKDDFPTKEHLRLILWAYSSDANRLKKSLDSIEQKLNNDKNKGRKRKSSGTSDSSSNSSEDEDRKKEESPKKKNK